jgi:type IV pilus assembly protein PilE
MKMKMQKGFSLIEVLIVLTILGILASLVVPAYSEYVIRGRIPDATSNLASKRVALEQFYQDNRTYLGAPACNADTTTSAYFDFSCTVQTAETYTLEAAGKGPMAGFNYSVDQANTKQTNSAPADWAAAAMPATCWITRKGGAC